LEFLTLLDKLTPVLIVIIPSYFSFKSTQNTKETEKQINVLSDEIGELKKSVGEVTEIGRENRDNLSLIGKGLQLGGNGAIKILFEKFLELEIIEEK